jgi:HEAT repeats
MNTIASLVIGITATGLQGSPAAPGPRVSARDLSIALTFGNASERAAAAEKLGELGSQAQPALPTMIKALNDSSEPVRRKVIYALSRLGKEAIKSISEAPHSTRAWMLLSCPGPDCKPCPCLCPGG